MALVNIDNKVCRPIDVAIVTKRIKLAQVVSNGGKLQTLKYGVNSNQILNKLAIWINQNKK